MAAPTLTSIPGPNARAWHRRITALDAFRLFAAVFVGLAVGFVVWRIFQYRVPFPFWDGTLVENYIDQVILVRRDLAAFTGFKLNEHRMVFPMLFWLLDHQWFASDGAAVIAINVALLAGMSVLVARWIRGTGKIDMRRLVLIAMVPLGMFWPAQAENLNWSMQINFFLSVAALFFAIPWILRAERLSRFRQMRGKALACLGIAALAGCVSAYSLTFGVVALPIFAVYLLCRRAPWWLVATTTLAAIAVVAPYAMLWTPISYFPSPLDTLLHRPLASIEFLFSLLGAPLHYLLSSPVWSPPDGVRIAVGGAVFGLGTIAAIRVFFRRAQFHTRAAYFDACLILMAVAMCANAYVTALGRINTGIGASYISRYVLIVVPVWLGVAGYWIPRLPKLRGLRVAGVAIAVLLFAAVAFSYLYQSTEFRARTAYTRLAAMAQSLDIFHPGIHPHNFLPAANLRAMVASLRRRGHPFFDEPWFAWYGRNAVSVFGAAIKGRCQGATDNDRHLDRKIHTLEGWAWDSGRRAPPDYVLVLDSDGIVRGVGFNGVRRFDLVKAHRRLRMFHAGWTAVAATPDARISIVGVTRDRKLCTIASEPVRKP